MSRIPPFPPGTIERMQGIMLTATRAKELRSAQCVYLAASADWSVKDIAALTGLAEKSVSIILSEYRALGEAAILCEDRGYVRRHAALSLSQEKQLLALLAAEHAQGHSITATYAWSVLQSHFGATHPKALVYSMFHRHGWTATGKQGCMEGNYIPPSHAPHSPGSHYRPRKSREHSSQETLRSILLTTDEEAAVMDFLEAELCQGRAVTLTDGQAAVQALCQILLSRQTMRRLFVRRGWRQLRRSGLAMWVIGDGFPEEELWNGLFDRHQTRLLSTAEEKVICQSLENALHRGEPVTARMAQDAMESKLNAAVSRNAAVKFLVRNGWRQVSKTGRIMWVKGDGTS